MTDHRGGWIERVDADIANGRDDLLTFADRHAERLYRRLCVEALDDEDAFSVVQIVLAERWRRAS